MKKTSSAKKGKGMEARKGPPPLRLSLDIETYSPVELAKSGVYRYAESPDFRVLLIGYSVNGGPVEVVDLASGDPLPTGLVNIYWMTPFRSARSTLPLKGSASPDFCGIMAT